MRYSHRRLCAAVTVLALVPAGTWAATLPQRGYIPRPCGFDMDDDGVVGEPEDCNVGDGVTLDPDGDGVNEDLIYVDCDAGSNGVTCGGSTSPCRTLAYAFNVRADGPGDGAEDIVAFAGTCSPSDLGPGVGGLSTIKLQTASGSEELDWLLPRDPVMLIGWDRDNDGSYPPFDADDTAILDGTGITWAFDFIVSNGSYFEMAHFSAEEYGRTGLNEGGFAIVARPYNYWHDLSLVNIGRETNSNSGRIAFEFFHALQADYFLLKNVECLDCGGFFTRGSPTNGPSEAGPYRFQNIHFIGHPCSYGSSPDCDAQPYSSVSKFWGWMTGIEWLDSVFDGAPENRNLGSHPSHWPHGITVAQCAQDFLIRNNEFLNVTSALGAQGFSASASSCKDGDARPVDNIVFDRNVVRFTTDKFQSEFIRLATGGDSAGEFVANVTITNNIFMSTGAGQHLACLEDDLANSGVPITGTIVYVNNTCIGPQAVSGFRGDVLIKNIPGNRQNNWIVKNNIFTGLTSGSTRNVTADYVPTNWQADYNVFDSTGVYRWGGAEVSTLADFGTVSGGDLNSRECDPSFTADGYHLSAGDSCATDAGTDLATLLSVDIDGDPRGMGAGWDAGADEAGAPLLVDGFESGDLTAWSAAVP